MNFALFVDLHITVTWWFGFDSQEFIKLENTALGFESLESLTTESDLLCTVMIKYLDKHFSASAKGRKDRRESGASLFSPIVY